MDAFQWWPDTEHPALADMADRIRPLLADKPRTAIQYAHATAPTAEAFYGETQTIAGPSFKVKTLRIERAWGPAPYTGPPFAYMWDVAVNDVGRWIAGPSRIEYIPQRPWDAA